MVSNDVLYYLCCLQMCLRNFSRGIGVLFLDLFKVWMRTWLYRSGQALCGVANALYWKSSKRQISTHLTVLKHQNTKNSLYKLSENHRFFALFDFFGFVRKRLQFTVYNDHPVLSHIILHCIILMQEDDHMQNWVTARHGRWQLYDHNAMHSNTESQKRIFEIKMWRKEK